MSTASKTTIPLEESLASSRKDRPSRYCRESGGIEFRWISCSRKNRNPAALPEPRTKRMKGAAHERFYCIPDSSGSVSTKCWSACCRKPGSRKSLRGDALQSGAGGKRLRPILTLAAAETFGTDSGAVMEIACAVEFIHTYSLIHDDLPAMDNSDLRRGKPTCHRVFGEAVAVLAGDALLTYAFELMARYGLERGCAREALQISAELARAAGVAGMIGGQVLDRRPRAGV